MNIIRIPFNSMVRKVSQSVDRMIFVVARLDRQLELTSNIKASGHGAALYSGRVKVLTKMQYDKCSIEPDVKVYFDSEIPMSQDLQLA